MLVLSRKSSERILIGNDIQVTVVAVSGGRVKLGFVAPPDISIQREELRNKIAVEGDGELDCPAAPAADGDREHVDRAERSAAQGGRRLVIAAAAR